MRRWYFAAVNPAIDPHQVLVTPELVQILTGVARNFITQSEFSNRMQTIEIYMRQRDEARDARGLSVRRGD